MGSPCNQHAARKWLPIPEGERARVVKSVHDELSGTTNCRAVYLENLLLEIDEECAGILYSFAGMDRRIYEELLLCVGVTTVDK